MTGYGTELDDLWDDGEVTLKMMDDMASSGACHSIYSTRSAYREWA